MSGINKETLELLNTDNLISANFDFQQQERQYSRIVFREYRKGVIDSLGNSTDESVDRSSSIELSKPLRKKLNTLITEIVAYNIAESEKDNETV